MDGGLVIEKEQLQLILSYSALVHHLDKAYAIASDYSTPDRHHHTLPNSTLLLMPAWSQSPERKAYIGLKLVGVFPDNPAQGLASVLGVYILSCGNTGRPLALINGTELTLWRTSCVSALAATYLAKAEPRTLAMVGAGALAPHLIQAHVAANPSITSVSIWNRTHERAIGVADSVRLTPGFEARNVDASQDLELIVRGADIVVCATMAAIPLVQGRWLKPGAHVSLVGAYTISMRECDDEAVKMSRVFVDSHGAVTQSGDLHGPISRSVIPSTHIIGDLADLVKKKKTGRRSEEEITLFKSVGSALQDLAAAELVYETAKEEFAA